MEFGVEARGRSAAQNVLTEQSGLSRFALRMADSPVGAFQIIFDNHMLKYIQQCRSSKSFRQLKNGRFHFVSSMRLLLCYMYEQLVAKTFPFTIFGMKDGAYHLFNKPCQEIVVLKLCIFYGSTCEAQSQHACKLTNLLLI